MGHEGKLENQNLLPLVEEILRTKSVRAVDGSTTFPLKDAIDEETGALLQELIEEKRPKVTMEIGLAYGISGLFICEALAKASGKKHIAVDAFQSSTWSGIGMHHLRQAGFGDLVELREQLSEDALPQMVQEGVKVDLAFIDGTHSFDQKIVDFFYVDRLLNVGGVIAFDDCDWASIRQACRYIATNRPYRVCGTTAGTPPGWRGNTVRWLARQSKGVGRLLNPKFTVADEQLGMPAGARCIAFEKMSGERPAVWPDSGYHEF
jgi:predicted O-methyltransferase YrrM